MTRAWPSIARRADGDGLGQPPIRIRRTVAFGLMRSDDC
jgi:hypothetical protein